MPESIEPLVANIRSASRLLVRELGFMNRNVAGTDLSPSAVHAVVEIDADASITAKQLGELLLLEKSSISRLVQSLVRKSLVTEKPAPTDARVKTLLLTHKGKQTLGVINRYAEARVSEAMAPLDVKSRESILNGLQLYVSTLQDSRQANQKDKKA